jgi:hypothetical protein
LECLSAYFLSKTFSQRPKHQRKMSALPGGAKISDNDGTHINMVHCHRYKRNCYKLLLISAIPEKGTNDDREMEEGQGDGIYKAMNFYAVNPSFNEKYGELLILLIQGEPDRTMGRITINAFSYSIFNGRDLVPSMYWEKCPKNRVLRQLRLFRC